LFGDQVDADGSVRRGALRHVHRTSSTAMVSVRSLRFRSTRVGCSVPG